ncbi:MAG: hypothetical protein HRT88_13940 [Lentisphaeraceae bacterium]|nr:hypothetical protein [Lentisphaeraceae bacterium]
MVTAILASVIRFSTADEEVIANEMEASFNEDLQRKIIAELNEQGYDGDICYVPILSNAQSLTNELTFLHRLKHR